MKTGLDPGILRHRLYVEAPYEVPDGAGGVTRAFETVGLVWGLQPEQQRGDGHDLMFNQGWP